MTDPLLVTESGGFNLPLSQTLCCLCQCVLRSLPLPSGSALVPRGHPYRNLPIFQVTCHRQVPHGLSQPTCRLFGLAQGVLKFHISRHFKIFQLYISFFFFKFQFPAFLKIRNSGNQGPSFHTWTISHTTRDCQGEVVAAAPFRRVLLLAHLCPAAHAP